MSSHGWLAEEYQISQSCLDDLDQYPEFESEFGGLGLFPSSLPPEESVHPRGTHFVELVQLVNGLDFHEVIHPIDFPALPSYLPEVFPRNLQGTSGKSLDGIAVQYSQLPWLKDGRFNAKAFLQKTRRTSSQISLITGNEKDGALERVWLASYRPEFWSSLRPLNPLLDSPDFSVYTHYRQNDSYRQGRFEQLFNMKRSLDFCRRASEHHYPCALHLSWAIRRDVERWCSYLKHEGAGVRLLSLNIQTQPATIGRLPVIIRSIEAEVGRSFTWIVQGACSEGAFALLRDTGLLESVTLVSASEQSLAIRRRFNDRTRSVEGANSLLIENVRSKRLEVKQIHDGVIRLPFDTSTTVRSTKEPDDGTPSLFSVA
jgi:hypothetical protein